jgi:hypothetical protein
MSEGVAGPRDGAAGRDRRPDGHADGADPRQDSRRRRGAGWATWAPRLTVAGLTILALALRLYRLESQSLWSDEGLSVYRAALPWRDILANDIVVDGVKTQDLSPPGYFLLLALVWRLAGESLFALRLPGALLGALSVPLAWQAGRLWLGRAAGLGAATAIAFSPIHVWYSQELRNYPLLLAAILGATWALAVATTATGRARRRAWTGWALLWAAAAASHAFALLGLAGHVAWLLLRATGGRAEGRPATGTGPASSTGATAAAPVLTLRRAVAAVAVAGALALPFAPRALQYFRADAQVDYAAVTFATIVRQSADAFAVGISPTLAHAPAATWPWLLLAAVGLGAGLIHIRHRRGAWLALSMLALPLLLLAGLSALRPIYNGPRHALVALPGFLLLAGAGLGLWGELSLTVLRWGRPRETLRIASAIAGRTGIESRAAPTAIALVLTFALILPAAWITGRQLHRQFHSPDYVKDDIRSAARDIAQGAGPADTVVLLDPLIQFAFDYEYRRAGGHVPWQTIPRFGEGERDAARRLRALGEEAPVVWLLERPKPRTGFDPDYLTEKADEAWTRTSEQGYARMWLATRWARYDTGLEDWDDIAGWTIPPQGGEPIGLRFGDGLLLHSVDLCPAQEQTAVLVPGDGRPDSPRLRLELAREADGLCVELRWQILAPHEVDWRVFLHLTSPTDAAPRQQADGRPHDAYVDFTGGTSDLSSGVFLRDWRRLSMPSDMDEAVLRLGLYDPNTGERATIFGPDGVSWGDSLLLAALRR